MGEMDNTDRIHGMDKMGEWIVDWWMGFCYLMHLGGGANQRRCDL